MGGKRRKVRRVRRWARIAVFLVSLVVIGFVVELVPTPARQRVHELAAEPTAPELASARQPAAVASPRYLTTSMPARTPQPTEPQGRLRVPRLDIDAPVVGVGWEHEAMAVPGDPGVLGWFTLSAHRTDIMGASLVAGHVADEQDRPGALAPLVHAKVGDVIEWADHGHTSRFRVVAVARYPRVRGLPPALLAIDGPHVLRLVTCTHRQVRGGSVHYTDNLVVSAVAL